MSIVKYYTNKIDEFLDNGRIASDLRSMEEMFIG
jgi:hypothetical protein